MAPGGGRAHARPPLFWGPGRNFLRKVEIFFCFSKKGVDNAGEKAYTEQHCRKFQLRKEARNMLNTVFFGKNTLSFETNTRRLGYLRAWGVE